MPLLTVRPLDQDDVFQDMARLVLKHRPHTKAGKVIVLQVQGNKARALARGARGLDADSIYLDDATRDRLDVSSGQQVEFLIQKGRFWDEFIWGWQATNAVMRVGTRLGVISLILGIIGLALGLWSIWIAFHPSI